MVTLRYPGYPELPGLPFDTLPIRTFPGYPGSAPLSGYPLLCWLPSGLLAIFRHTGCHGCIQMLWLPSSILSTLTESNLH
jgi:hypothetical protein